MAWRKSTQEAPELIVTADQCITWNEAAHAMMEYPVWVDMHYNANRGRFAIVGRRDSGAYGVRLQDTGYYLIKCAAALTEMGMGALAEPYVTTPREWEVIPPTVDDPGQVLMNSIWAPVKP